MDRAHNSLGVTGAAKLLNLSVRRVQRLCESGELHAVKIGRIWVLDLNEVLCFERKSPGVKLGQKIYRGTPPN